MSLRQRELDLTLDLKAIAVAFLHLMRDLPEQCDGYGEDSDLVRYQTAAWYNCRERGWTLRVSRRLMETEDDLVLAFSEHRNTDSLRVDKLQAQVDINPPSIRDVDRFLGTWTFSDLAEARDWLIGQVQEFLATPDQAEGLAMTQRDETRAAALDHRGTP